MINFLQATNNKFHLQQREASLFIGWGTRYPAEWVKFFGRAFRSGRNFMGVCFVVGEKF